MAKLTSPDPPKVERRLLHPFQNNSGYPKDIQHSIIHVVLSSSSSASLVSFVVVPIPYLTSGHS